MGRSWFSLQQGTTPVPVLVRRAAAQGYRALALADRGGMYGAPAFVAACRAAGIKPILGCTLPFGGHDITFLATSPAGYSSLCRLVTAARTGGSPEQPGPGLVALVSRPEAADRLQEACPVYLRLDPGAPAEQQRALAATGRPVLAAGAGELRWAADELERAFAWCPAALQAATDLDGACSDPWPAPDLRLPAFPGDLRALARAGLADRYGAAAPYEQLERELAIITSRGQAGYFLILWDLVRYARQQGIPIGPGRGSAVGSLTAYALGITGIDPLAHRLYFERFLNPERPDLPDIDLDVCSRGRPRLLEYLHRRHGREHVAQVGTLSTLGPRAAVREAGPRLHTKRDVVDAVANALPHAGTIADAVRSLPEFRYIDTGSEPVRSLLVAAQELEGRPWHASVHAAGVVIAPEPLAELVPLETTAGGEVITQYSADELAGLGLIKLDVLGLRNLTVIADAAAGAGLDPQAIPADDPAAFALLGEGETLGVFQLDSPGIRNLLRQVRPEQMADLIAVLSLYRPGPFEAGAVDAFTRRRRGREPVRHLHPALAPILDETYGVLLYQEQAMRIAHEVGGLSLAEADQLRRALARGRAAGYRERFVQGATGRRIPGGAALRIFGLLERFSGYSFNKAHTAAYAQISYQTAYLKAHHPAHYFAALLAVESGYFGPQVYIREAARLGVRVLPPHVNQSQATYAVEGADAIRAGLLQVKGVGPGAAAAILAARQGGPFRSVADLSARVPSRHRRPPVLAALRAEGAFAGLEAASPPGQLTLFDLGLAPAAQPPVPPEVAVAPGGDAVRMTGPIITSWRRRVQGDQLGLMMLLQVGQEQLEVIVPPAVYARDLLAIDPAGVTVEGRLRRQGLRRFVVAGAIHAAS